LLTIDRKPTRKGFSSVSYLSSVTSSLCFNDTRDSVLVPDEEKSLVADFEVGDALTIEVDGSHRGNIRFRLTKLGLIANSPSDPPVLRSPDLLVAKRNPALRSESK